MSLKFKYDKTDWGLYITLQGKVCAQDLEYWYKKLFNTDDVKFKKSFNMILKFDHVDPVCPDAANLISLGRAYLIGKGLNRTAIIFDSSAVIVNILRAFKVIGAYRDQRLIPTINELNYENKALRWVRDGVEP